MSRTAHADDYAASVLAGLARDGAPLAFVSDAFATQEVPANIPAEAVWIGDGPGAVCYHRPNQQTCITLLHRYRRYRHAMETLSSATKLDEASRLLLERQRAAFKSQRQTALWLKTFFHHNWPEASDNSDPEPLPRIAPPADCWPDQSVAPAPAPVDEQAKPSGDPRWQAARVASLAAWLATVTPEDIPADLQLWSHARITDHAVWLRRLQSDVRRGVAGERVPLAAIKAAQQLKHASEERPEGWFPGRMCTGGAVAAAAGTALSNREEVGWTLSQPSNRSPDAGSTSDDDRDRDDRARGSGTRSPRSAVRSRA